MGTPQRTAGELQKPCNPSPGPNTFGLSFSQRGCLSLSEFPEHGMSVCVLASSQSPTPQSGVKREEDASTTASQDTFPIPSWTFFFFFSE